MTTTTAEPPTPPLPANEAGAPAPSPRPPEMDRDALVDDLASVAVSATRWTGWVAGGLFVGLFAIAAFAPVSSGTIAFGQLSPAQSRQVVQHPTGGVVAEILVEDGQKVNEGDVLLRLAGVEEGAAAGIASAEIFSLRAEEIVRAAEARGQSGVAFPADMRAAAGRDPALGAVLRAQSAAFEARRARLRTTTAQIEARRAQIVEQIESAEARLASTRTQIALINEEAAGLRQLYEKGLAPRTRLLALERAGADLAGTEQSLTAEARRLAAEDVELAAQGDQLAIDARAEAAEALRQVQASLSQAGFRVTAANDALSRIEVRAPVTGAVVGLRFKTLGGVIGPGEPIMEITPDTDLLVVRARVLPQHADDVRLGAEATVQFLNAPDAPRVKGSVRHISADALEDMRTGEPYFEARVEIPESEAARLPPNAFAPGLPAEVLIHSGSRSILSYLVAPIDRVSFRALRES